MLLHDCGLHRCVDSHLKATSLITLATESAGEQDECVIENPRTRAANDEGVYKHAKIACQPPVRTSNAQHMKQPTVYTTIFVLLARDNRAHSHGGDSETKWNAPTWLSIGHSLTRCKVRFSRG